MNPMLLGRLKEVHSLPCHFHSLHLYYHILLQPLRYLVQKHFLLLFSSFTRPPFIILLPHQLISFIFDAVISFIGKADFRRISRSSFKKIQRSPMGESTAPFGDINWCGNICHYNDYLLALCYFSPKVFFNPCINNSFSFSESLASGCTNKYEANGISPSSNSSAASSPSFFF